MLWTIAMLLVVIWALAMMLSFTLGGRIHALLAVALLIALVSALQDRIPPV